MSKNAELELIMKPGAGIYFGVHLEKSSMEMNDPIQQAYSMEAMARRSFMKGEQWLNHGGWTYTCKNYFLKVVPTSIHSSAANF